ncbi:MAG: biotin/lipoyl-binding protein [Burkholderiaceae bacterium]
MDAESERSEAASVEALLGAKPGRSKWRRFGRWALTLFLVAAGFGAYRLWWSGDGATQAPRYVTEPVVRRTLRVNVVANGTLAPTRSVNVGSELSGTVASVLVDLNDRVQKGQLLVALDTSRLRDQISRARAALASAEAKVAQAAATVGEARSSLARMNEVWRLSAGKVPSATELDSARAKLARALADERAARAAVSDGARH